MHNREMIHGDLKGVQFPSLLITPLPNSIFSEGKRPD